MEFLDALGGWPVADALRRSRVLYPLLNAAHIFSIGLVIGSIVTLDLRLLGLFRAFPLAALAPPLARTAACGVVLALVTGFLLFSVKPAEYVQNSAFLLKLALVTLGVVNALILRAGPHWGTLQTGAVSVPVRLMALFSLLTWMAAVLAGRWIAFVD
jgi:hypothetical protein